MATSTTTSAVYIHVIEDVISKVRDEFVNNGGPGDAVLSELQGIWEMKMMQAGVICGPIDRSSAPRATPPMHDLNVPYEGTEEYETPTAEMLFPPTPLQTPAPTPFAAPTPFTASTPVPGSVDSSLYNYPTPASEIGNNVDVKGSRASPYMQPPSPWTNQRSLTVDVNVAPVEGRDEVDRGTTNQSQTQDFLASSGKRKREEFARQFSNGGYIPQQDGGADANPEEVLEDDTQCRGRSSANGDFQISLTISSLKIPQVDGPLPDPYDEILSTPNIYNYQGGNEDYNVANTPAPDELPASTPVPQHHENGNDDDNDDEELLNEDDDDDELDDMGADEDMNIQHLVLAQFDKVTRTKSRWKCTLKDGIMHINNKDMLFNKATGEFDF